MCSRCEEPLAGVKQKKVEKGYLFCQPCWVELYAPSCFVCGEKIFSGERAGRRAHPLGARRGSRFSSTRVEEPPLQASAAKPRPARYSRRAVWKKPPSTRVEAVPRRYRHPGCKKPPAPKGKATKRIGPKQLAGIYDASDDGGLPPISPPTAKGKKKVVKKKKAAPNPYAGLE